MPHGYHIQLDTLVRSVLGFEVIEQGSFNEEVLEGTNDLESEEMFNAFIERYASFGDTLIIHDNNEYVVLSCVE